MTPEERISRLEQQVKSLLVILRNYAADGYPPVTMFTKFPSTVSLPKRESMLLNTTKKMLELLEEK